MDDTELHARLETMGYAKEYSGGGAYVYRNGNVIISGADGDLPALHWYCVSVYADATSGEDGFHYFFDWSAEPEFSDLGDGPRNILADISAAELMASRYAEAIADDPAMTPMEAATILADHAKESAQ